MTTTRLWAVLALLHVVALLGFAEMNIYLKDGSVRSVDQIVFRGEQADLYLKSGLIFSVNVDSIDLKSSGISNPSGTYGGQSVSRNRQSKPAHTASFEDTGLQDLWELSKEAAVALSDHGSISKGDRVKIVSRNSSVVSIIQKTAGGKFKKLMMDSSEFFHKFKIESAMPSHSTDPIFKEVKKVSKLPQDLVPTPQTTVPQIPKLPAERVERSRSIQEISYRIPILIGCLIIGSILVAAYLTQKQRHSFSNIHFDQKTESILRNSFIPKWAQEGHSSKRLAELCLARLYSGRPQDLEISRKILNGDPKSLVVASIMRKNVKSIQQAESIYHRLREAVDISNSLVISTSPSQAASPSSYSASHAGSGLSAGFSYAVPAGRIEIVNRPLTITICSVFLLISAGIVVALLMSNFPGLELLREAIGTHGLVISVIHTLACGYAYWTMRKWGVLLYAIEPLLRWWVGVPGHLIAFPLFIVAGGIIYFDDMTWK